jgi:hypothetical protein
LSWLGSEGAVHVRLARKHSGGNEEP